MGVIFLLGVVLVEWPTAIREGLTPSSGPYGAVFFMMTGMHAFHVFTGLIFLMVVYLNARRGLYDQKNYPVEAAAVYWHFVDLVWIFYYPALYLIGSLLTSLMYSGIITDGSSGRPVGRPVFECEDGAIVLRIFA